MRLAAFLLTACAHIPFPSAPAGQDAYLIDAAVQAYAEGIGDPGPVCRDRQPHIRIARLPDLTEACGANALACMRWQSGIVGQLSARRRNYVLVVNTTRLNEHRQRLAVIHEAFHALEDCDGRDVFFHGGSPPQYAPGWREAELAAQRAAGLRMREVRSASEGDG